MTLHSYCTATFAYLDTTLLYLRTFPPLRIQEELSSLIGFTAESQLRFPTFLFSLARSRLVRLVRLDTYDRGYVVHGVSFFFLFTITPTFPNSLIPISP